MIRLFAGVLVCLIVEVAADAASTQDMRMEGSASFLEGKFSGTGLNDLGELVAGYQASKASAVEEAAYILSSAPLRSKTYFCAGYPAALIVYDGKSASTLARFPGEFVVSAIASDGRHLYAAMLPSTIIYKVDEKGDTQLFVDFSTGASSPNYVWALSVYKGFLYVALGGHFPSVYRVDLKTSKKELLHQIEGKSKNVTALLVTDDGIYFGDDAGRVYHRPHGSSSRSTVLYSFSDAEIKSMALFENGLAVAVNSRRFIPPAPPQPVPKEPGEPGKEPVDEGGGEADLGVGMELKKAIEAMATSVGEKLREAGAPEAVPSPGLTDAVNAKPPPPSAPSRPESPAGQSPSPLPVFQDPFGKGEGNLFWMAQDGSRVHRLWQSLGSMVLSISADASGVWIATSNPARLYRITGGGTERLFYESTSKDLSVIVTSGKLMLAAASNPALILELEPSSGGEYSSKVFDAGFPAKIGRPEVAGPAPDAVDLFLRSGATADIDSGWTDYKSLTGVPAHTSGRFFQVKLKLKSAEASIRRVRLPYRVQNLYPRLQNLYAEVIRAQDVSSDGRDIRFQWDVTNLDNDVLEYQILYQPPGSKKFIPMYEPGQRPRNVKTVNVPAEQFPDGTYRFKLEASDEPSNGAAEALTNQSEFPLVLLDRTPPPVDLKQEGDRVRWQAGDASSRIVRAEYRLDGGPWKALQPDDGLFDSASESGRIPVPANFGAGSAVDMRCYDERENSRITSLILK